MRDCFLTVLLDVAELACELLDADGWVVANSSAVRTVGRAEAVVADPAVEGTLRVVADELVGSAMLRADVEGVHHGSI